MLVKISPTKEIPSGGIKPFEVNGRKVAVANLQSQFFAFDDVCSHAQCSLSKGELEENVVECPCHGAKFNVQTGKVLSLPAVEDIKTYPVQIKDGYLYVED